MLSRKVCFNILKTYGEAWTGQNVEKILSIFAPNATYSEKAFEKPLKGHRQIANYWKKKVCKEQSKIKFKLLNYYICGNTLVAEWEASFNSNVKHRRIHIREVVIITVKNGKIASLREYWHSKKLATLHV